MGTEHKDAVVLDDGRYYIELNGNYDVAEAPGFLQVRCYVGVTTPGGYECIGAFSRKVDGLWVADIAAHYDIATDSDVTVVGSYRDRLDAIVALWGRRHDALRRHVEG